MCIEHARAIKLYLEHSGYNTFVPRTCFRTNVLYPESILGTNIFVPRTTRNRHVDNAPLKGFCTYCILSIFRKTTFCSVLWYWSYWWTLLGCIHKRKGYKITSYSVGFQATNIQTYFPNPRKCRTSYQFLKATEIIIFHFGSFYRIVGSLYCSKAKVSRRIRTMVSSQIRQQSNRCKQLPGISVGKFFEQNSGVIWTI